MWWFNLDYLTTDLAQLIYHAKELAIGRIPYRDIFSHHFLGLLLPLRVIDIIWSISPGQQWALCLAYNFCNAILIFLIVRELASPREAAVSGH